MNLGMIFSSDNQSVAATVRALAPQTGGSFLPELSPNSRHKPHTTTCVLYIHVFCWSTLLNIDDNVGVFKKAKAV